MTPESIENALEDIPDTHKENKVDDLEDAYARYLKLGGEISNEKEYQQAIDKMISTHTLDRSIPEVKSSILQAEQMANHANIKLNNLGNVLDPRVQLYAILRTDGMPEGAKRHHSQMTDQKLFAEVLRMYEDKDSLDQLMKAYPHIFSPK